MSHKRIVEYRNKYGTVKFEIIDGYKEVKGNFLHADTPDKYKFDIGTVEKIALITELRKLQPIANPNNLSQWMTIHHLTGSIAGLCEIIHLEFISPVNPAEEIKRRRHF